MRPVPFDPGWPESWQLSYRFDQLELYGQGDYPGYTYAYRNRVDRALQLVRRATVDQRAMEDGEYDFAAIEKNRVEEKQRAARRAREAKGEEFKPKWFEKRLDTVTGEEFWETTGRYWKAREMGDWSVCDDIF